MYDTNIIIAPIQVHVQIAQTQHSLTIDQVKKQTKETPSVKRIQLRQTKNKINKMKQTSG
jgi:hypothetical protein